MPANTARAGLTAQQANWKDSSENHSIAQLTTHLIFWDTRGLNTFNGIRNTKFDGDNKETFSPVTEESWKASVKTLDSLMTAWEVAITNAGEAKLLKGADLIAHTGTHNAYHIGQILYIRKMKGWWDDKNGVR